MLPNGSEFTDEDWENGAERSLGMLLNGNEIPDRDARGERVTGDSLMLLLHSGDIPLTWTMPRGWDEGWTVVLDTGDANGVADGAVFRAGEDVALKPYSMVVLRHQTAEATDAS